jgi:hypothetical protein
MSACPYNGGGEPTKSSKLTVEDMRYLRSIDKENRKARLRKNTEFQNTSKYNLINNIKR